MATNWEEATKPLIKKHKGKQHPLEYKNIYQLIVMVVLSARDSDKHINNVVPPFFKVYPDMKALAKAKEKDVLQYLGKVINSANKVSWLLTIAQTMSKQKDFPLTIESLSALPGIGRKSANVIMREAGVKAEGVMVDLHVVRVVARLGIATGTDPKKIEVQLMDVLPQKDWSEIGMAISFLGRETCRPSNPKHSECVMKEHCEYYSSLMKTPVRKVAVKKTENKKIAVKKSVAKKSVVKKTVTKKSAAKKTAAKKSK